MQGLILGRSPGQQAELLKTLFLDVDKLMATDEGCTATVVLLQRDQDGSCLVQVWPGGNVCMSCSLQGASLRACSRRVGMQ